MKQQTQKTMKKLTQMQLNKANLRVRKKYPEYRVVFINDLREKTRVVYDFWIGEPTENEKYIYSYLQSLLHIEDKFDDFYYSI